MGFIIPRVATGGAGVSLDLGTPPDHEDDRFYALLISEPDDFDWSEIDANIKKGVLFQSENDSQGKNNG